MTGSFTAEPGFPQGLGAGQDLAGAGKGRRSQRLPPPTSRKRRMGSKPWDWGVWPRPRAGQGRRQALVCHQAGVSHVGFASLLSVVQARIPATQLGQGWGSSLQGLGAACLVPPSPCSNTVWMENGSEKLGGRCGGVPEPLPGPCTASPQRLLL